MTGPRRAAGLAAVLALGLAVRLPTLDAPLLEGAAGKQTHTAMVARNLLRGRCTWTRPIIDDIGKPGYFVKEIPVFAALAGASSGLSGAPLATTGRLVGALSWMVATLALWRLLAPLLPPAAALAAAAWMMLAPMALVYSRAFMTDALAVAVSLWALRAAVSAASHRSLWRLLLLTASVATSVLLKPHVVFWLGPGIAVIAAGFGSGGTQPQRRWRTPRLDILATAAAGVAAALPWYLHAAAIHRIFPTPGATVASGWVDPSLLANLDLYRVILAQEALMVFTPVGLALAVAGLFRRAGAWSTAELALLAWGGGVLLQCMILATRMFDDLSRGTEYYQLAMVPVASLLIARGLLTVARLTAARGAMAQKVLIAGVVAGLAIGATLATRSALAAPPRYRDLLDKCAVVQRFTQPHDELLVIADRPGVVLFHCDRRGATLVPVASQAKALRSSAEPTAAARGAEALARARYVYVPFPDLLEQTPELAKLLEREWVRVPAPDAAGWLLARPGQVPNRGRSG